jgi:TRAP-type uncharacterized transport system fused permease subunit
MNHQVRNYLFITSCILVLVGAVMYITHWFSAPYLFAVGTAGITLSFMTAPYQNLDLRHQRLHRINVIAGISMIVSSVFMFRRKTEWVVFLLISAMLILYTSFISPPKDID